MYDANAARLARQKGKTQASFTWGDPPQPYLLPVEIPVKMILETGKLDKAREDKDGLALVNSTQVILKMLLGKQYADYLKADPTLDDMLGVIEHYSNEMGESAGESSGSES